MEHMPEIQPDESASTNLLIWLNHLKSSDAPQVYVIIDEYDNFANHLITAHQDFQYKKQTADDSFPKTYFKVLKAGRQTGALANIFITGILPITIDDLSSAYNIADFITLHPQLEGLLGFTENEVHHLLDQVYWDYDLDPTTRQSVNEVIKTQYNGYHFVNAESCDALYNFTMVMYFIREFCRLHTIPNNLIDLNLRTDLSWVQRITGSYPESTDEIVRQLAAENIIRYDNDALISQFNISDFFNPSFYLISFFYLGMLTRQDDFYLCLPNLSMKKIFIEYFNGLYQIDVSTRYTKIMERFIVSNHDIGELFAGYWHEYVSQLPEAIFAKVNENFYRTTFYEVCSRFCLSGLPSLLNARIHQAGAILRILGNLMKKLPVNDGLLSLNIIQTKNLHLIGVPRKSSHFRVRMYSKFLDMQIVSAKNTPK
jgi:hypothetical protein